MARAHARVKLGVILIAYWVAQAAAVHVLNVLWFALVPDSQDQLVGNPFRGETLIALARPELLMTSGIAAGVIAVAQGLFILPVRRPGVSGAHGRSVRTTLIAAGLGIGALVFGSLIAATSAISLITDNPDWVGEEIWELIRVTPGQEWTWLIVTGAVCWTIPTLLLMSFVRPGRREGVVSRLANRLLIGTAAEVCLLIPLDVMVRRKSDCYCSEGTFFALTLAGWVGVLGAGPAVFVPLIAKRRRRWYAGRCEACGYDMSAIMDAERCPECGVGWRASRQGPEAG